MTTDREIPRGTATFSGLVVVHFDGSCQPPTGGGVAGYGFTVEGQLNHQDFGLAVRPGSPNSTNNVAEYVAAIRALEWLRSSGFRGKAIVVGDSELVVRQMNGEYAVRAEHLQAYHDRLAALAKEFEEVEFRHVPREENRRADELSKRAVRRELESGALARPRPMDLSEESTGRE
jgi:ribonuclease HI